MVTNVNIPEKRKTKFVSTLRFNTFIKNASFFLLYLVTFTNAKVF